MIGGNIKAILQQKSTAETNAIGEKIPTWTDVDTLWGFLDLSSGESHYTYNTKLQESTHIFICDHTTIDGNAANKRLLVNGAAYDVLLIDNPMELNQQLEIYLKFVG